uniref:KRAB domain-containing protein n=1 Tax=Gopherus agassizii TaxID=38772 RepID=A0A452GTY5_9SAUR
GKGLEPGREMTLHKGRVILLFQMLVTFEEVAVYFTQGQGALDVMQENYQTVTSLGKSVKCWITEPTPGAALRCAKTALAPVFPARSGLQQPTSSVDWNLLSSFVC